jgi:AraC-like DNA-binding protein
MGVEILVDPSSRALPYPNDSIIAFDIPLSGKPARRTYRPLFGNNGSYKLQVQAKKQDLPVKVETTNGKGWRLICTVPVAPVLAASQTLRCNIVIKPSAGTDSTRFSWAGSAGATYAPVKWGTITLAGGGFFASTPWIWMVSFVAAFSLTAIIGFFAIFRRRRVRQMSMHRTDGVPEEHREILEKIRTFIEGKVIDRTASLESAAAELGLPGQSVNRLCKRHFGWHFQQCLMLSRTEVARERLRSSNAPEKSIASMCGFSDESEMEKCFLRFYRTTPAKYRQEQQVT